MKEITVAGPAYCEATMPGRTKIAAPTIAPIPMRTRSRSPRSRRRRALSPCFTSSTSPVTLCLRPMDIYLRTTLGGVNPFAGRIVSILLDNVIIDPNAEPRRGRGAEATVCDLQGTVCQQRIDQRVLVRRMLDELAP